MIECAQGPTWAEVLGLPIALVILFGGVMIAAATADAITAIGSAKADAARALSERKKDEGDE
jgi:hypothetical protein